jgi:DNA mismatch repair protein MutS
MLLWYLEQNQKSDLSHLNTINFDSFSSFMDLDEATIKNLDLIYNIWSKSTTIWTLFWILDKTETSMWKRLLRENIIKPLQNKKDIENGLDLIEEFLSNPILLDKVNNKLKLVSDLDNILTRLALNRALPRDLLNLKKSLQSIIEIFTIIKQNWNKKIIKLLKIK